MTVLANDPQKFGANLFVKKTLRSRYQNKLKVSSSDKKKATAWEMKNVSITHAIILQLNMYVRPIYLHNFIYNNFATVVSY